MKNKKNNFVANKDKNNMTNNNSGGMIIYEGADGEPSIEVCVEGETVWLLN